MKQIFDARIRESNLRLIIRTSEGKFKWLIAGGNFPTEVDSFNYNIL
jgi:hypothetical protein